MNHSRLARFVLAGSLLAIASPAWADPVYLTCDFTYQGKPQPRKFTVSESRGSVAIFYPETAEIQTLPARFSEKTVLFETYVDRYGINRTSLVAIRQAKLDGKMDQAQCRIVTPEKRAF